MARRSIVTSMELMPGFRREQQPPDYYPGNFNAIFRDEVPPSYLAQLATHARQNDGDILVGMVEAPSGAHEYYNSMFSFGTSPDQSYRKHHLVPFGEFIPLKLCSDGSSMY